MGSIHKKLINAILLLSLLTLINACDRITPGMNMNTAPMVKAPVNNVKVAATLVPISAELIRNQYDFTPVIGITSGRRILLIFKSGITLNLMCLPSNYPKPPKPTSLQQNLILQQSVSAGTYGYGYLVGPDGTLFFPMVGNVPVSGLTAEQIRSRLAQKLTRYVRNPQVQVRVTSFRSQKIYVMGEVIKPGVQAITDVPLSITDAISLAGGVDQQTSDPSHIYVIRGSVYHPIVYWLDAKSPDALILGSNFHLRSHDIVYVSTADVVRWNRVISQILPTIETIWYTNSLITNR